MADSVANLDDQNNNNNNMNESTTTTSITNMEMMELSKDNNNKPQPTPAQLEDGLLPQNPPSAHLAPNSRDNEAPQSRCSANTLEQESDFKVIENQIESGSSTLQQHHNNHSNNEETPQDNFDEYMADKKDLQRLADDFPLPLPKHNERYNKLRYAHFAVYQRLFAVVVGINLVLIATFAALLTTTSKSAVFMYGDAVTAVAANILLAMLMRQENCINMLFHSVLSLPRSWPVSIRRHAAKVYCYGGVHTASGISAVLWYLFFVVLVFRDFVAVNEALGNAVKGLAGVIMCLLVTLCAASYPTLRAKFHNQWELSHRFLGWTLVVLIWIQLCCVVASDALKPESSSNMGSILVKTPAFWMLLIISFLLVYPWMRLRKVYLTVEKLSAHAIQVHVKTKKPIPTCVGISFSRSPLIENHKFATIPNPDKESAFSVIIANNGDWTHQLINDSPPPFLWTRGIPSLGVARVSKIFRRIVLVATGSGIGPLMSFFNSHPEWAMRIVWSARTPALSYGKKNMQNVLRADPKAIILDTSKTSFKEEGMPDLVRLAYGAYRDFEAEGVVVISNPKVTKEVVFALESRKVPAYGAIFDS